MWVRGVAVNFELFAHRLAELAFGKHTQNGLLDDALRMLGELILDGYFAQPAGIERVDGDKPFVQVSSL